MGGDPNWVTWLSVVGYTSEVSTALMNYRWYLINTLEEDWVGFGVTNVLTVLGWGGRVIMFTYLLVVEILPRYELYKSTNKCLLSVLLSLATEVSVCCHSTGVTS